MIRVFVKRFVEKKDTNCYSIVLRERRKIRMINFCKFISKREWKRKQMVIIDVERMEKTRRATRACEHDSEDPR